MVLHPSRLRPPSLGLDRVTIMTVGNHIALVTIERLYVPVQSCVQPEREARVNPEQAKTVAGAMAALWQGEFPATVRVLSAVNDANRDYRPHPKSRTAWELATHIATADTWFIDCIAKGTFAFDPAAAKRAETQFRQIADVAAYYESTLPGRLAQLPGLPGEALSETVDFFGMMRMTRAQWIGFANNHSVHHRGQLSAYLRALGSKVPDIYGPSADAEPAPAVS